MDRRPYGGSSWESDASRRYRERSLFFKPRSDIIYVNGKRHRVNNYASTTDSPVSPFGRNHILLNASPQGMLKVSRRSDLPHEWAPRLITTDFSLPSTPQRCQSSMDLRKSVAYTSAEDIRYHTMRKAGSCDNILRRGQYLSPGPPQSESGVSVSDLESIFLDDDAQSQSSLSSFDRSFTYSEFDSESIHDRLNVINEDEAFENPQRDSLATGSAHSHLAHGRVNPKVLTEELLRLKDEREKRKQLRKSQDVKAYIENNFPNQRNFSSTSSDSCLGRSVGDEVDGNSLHENYGQSTRRRLRYSSGSPYSPSSSGIGYSRFASVDDAFAMTSTETTCVDNLPGSYELERDGRMLKGRNNSYGKYENMDSYGENSKFSYDRTQYDSVNSVIHDSQRKQNINSNNQLSISQNEYSQSDNEYVRCTSSPKVSQNRRDITHTEETVEFSDIDIKIDESLESKHDQSDILDDVLNRSKHSIKVSDNTDEWEENDNKIEYTLDTCNSFSEQTSIVSESPGNLEEKGENVANNEALKRVELLKLHNLDSRDYSVAGTIDFRDQKIPENKYNSQSAVETIDCREQNQELDDDSSISERKPDYSTDFHASINSQTLVAGKLTPESDKSLFTRETCEGHKKENSLETNRAERNYYLRPNSQSELNTDLSEVTVEDTSHPDKNSRHFIRNIDGSVSRTSDQDYSKTTVVTGRSFHSPCTDINNVETEIGKFNDEKREKVDIESYHELDFERKEVRKQPFTEENTVNIEAVSHSSLSAHQTDDAKNILLVKKEPLVQYDESDPVFNEENKLSGISRTVLKPECESQESQWATREWRRTDTVVTKHYYSNQDVVNEEKAHTNKPKQTVGKQFSEIHREINQERIDDGIQSNVQHTLIKDNLSTESVITSVSTNLEKENLCEIRTDSNKKQLFVQNWTAEDSESDKFDNYSEKIIHENPISSDTELEKINENQIAGKVQNEEKSISEEVRTDVQHWIVDNDYSSSYETVSRETKEYENISPGITSGYPSLEEKIHTHVDHRIIPDKYSIKDSDTEVEREEFDTEDKYALIKENTSELQKRNAITDNKHSIDWIVKVDENEITELKEETQRGVDHWECFITTEPCQIKLPTSKVTTNTPLCSYNVTLKRDSCEIQDSQTSVNSEEIPRNSEVSASKSLVSRTFDSHSVEITSTAVTSSTVDYEHDIINITHPVSNDNIETNIDIESICGEEGNSSIANYSSITHDHQIIASDNISHANEVTKSVITENAYINQGVLSVAEKLYEFSNTNREVLREEDKSCNIHESTDENSHKGISQHLPSTLPFIDRTEHVISQSIETLIIPRSTITHQSSEILSSSSGSARHNTRDLFDSSSTKEDYLHSYSINMEGRADNFEEEVYDNLEDFKSVRKTGLKLNLAKNPNSILTRYRMQTIGEHEEVNFSNRLEYATVHRPATPVENVAFAQKNSATQYSTMTQLQHRDVSRQSVVKNEQSNNFTSVETNNSESFYSKNYNFNSSFSDIFSQPRFNMTGSQFIAPMHSSPYQHDSAINYERNTNVRKELIPTSTHQTKNQSSITTSSTMQFQNLILGEIGNENMGQTFQFGRRGPVSLEEEEEEEWERLKETVEIKEQSVSFSEVDANWNRSNESININDLSFISDSSSIYQASCSAEITDHEESGYETKYQESELLNISCDSSSTYSAICTAEVNVDSADRTEQISSPQNTIVLSPTSEVSDPESGYYTLPRAGHDTLRSQDTAEDMTNFLDEDNDRTIYHDQMFGEIGKEHASVQLERALSSEDITSFVESCDTQTDTQTMVRRGSNGATVHHVNSQDDISRYSKGSSHELNINEQNLSEMLTDGRTMRRANTHEDPRSFTATQRLQDIVDFSEKLAAEFESFADESLEEDSSSYQLEIMDETDAAAIPGGYKVEAVAEISSEDIQFDTFEVRNATKIVKTEVQCFNSVENVTESFDFSHASGQYKVEASAEISSDDIHFDYLNEVKNSTRNEKIENFHAVENSYGYLESENNENVKTYKDHAHVKISESFHDDVFRQATKVIRTEVQYFNSTEDLTGCIEIDVEDETVSTHEDQSTNKSDNFTENSSKQMSAEDVATLRRLSVGEMDTMVGSLVHLPRVSSTEDLTSFEKTINKTKHLDKSTELYTNLELSSVALKSRIEEDNDKRMDRAEDEDKQLMPFVDRAEHIVSQPYEKITVSRHSASHHFDVSSFLSVYTHPYNQPIDEVTDSDLAVKNFEKINQDASVTRTKYSEEEEMTKCIETTYIYSESNVKSDEIVLEETMQRNIAEEEDNKEEQDEKEREEEEEFRNTVETTYLHDISSCNENVENQELLLNQKSYGSQNMLEEELIIDNTMPYQTEAEDSFIEAKDGKGKIEAIRLSSHMEVSNGGQIMARPYTESHSMLMEEDSDGREIENVRRNLKTTGISDCENVHYQIELDKSRSTQDDLRTMTETTTTTTTQTTVESRAWHEQNIRTSHIQSSLSEDGWKNNVQGQLTQSQTKMAEKTSDYETNSQIQTTEEENWMSQSDDYDISSTSSQYVEESTELSAKTNVTDTEDEVIHEQSSQRNEPSLTIDDYEINTHTRTLEDKLREMIYSEPSIDHTEQFESLVEKDRDKIQMFIIYQDFAQLRERARLKKELELLSEQCDHLENRNLENRTEKLLKINSFLDCFLQNLKITENLQVMKSKLENVKYVERAHFYRDNSLVYEQMQKFSDIIRDLDLHRDDERLDAKLTYCLKFLKSNTLDAQFESLADFVSQESEKEDMELLQNHLCLTKDGNFGSRRLLKYLGRGFSSDMKTIWKPKIRNNLQSVCEDEESVFHLKNHKSSLKHSNGDKRCCEYHESDKSCSAQLELWSESVQEDSSSSQKISRTAYIN